MKYYKIKDGASVLGIGDSSCLHYYQAKHKVWMKTDENRAEAILPYGQDILYHAYWMYQSDRSVAEAVDAEVIEIAQEEFNELYETLVIEDKPVIEEEPVPISEPEPDIEELPLTMRDLLDIISDLQERVSALESK